MPLTVALDEVPKKLWVDENLFSDTGIIFLESNFGKRHVRRRKEPRRVEIWSSATVRQHMVLDADGFCVSKNGRQNNAAGVMLPYAKVLLSGGIFGIQLPGSKLFKC